jgi:hypothetical protein
MKIRLWASVVILLLAASAGYAASGEIVVKPDSSGKPVIAPALNAARPGSRIFLRPGVYRESIVIEKPVTIVGAEGAVLDLSEAFQPRWEPSSAHGKGVYEASVAGEPAVLLIDGKVLARVNPDRPETRRGGTWKRLLENGPPRTGFSYVRGVWLYSVERNVVLVHLENDVSPAEHKWFVVWQKSPAITLRNTTGASVRHVTVANAYKGVVITGNCSRCSVLDSRIGPWEMYGIEVVGGSSESLVRGNEVFRGSYEDLTPQNTLDPVAGATYSRDWYEIWQLHKIFGYWDRVGISVTLSGAGNRIIANRVHDVFDGINLGEGEMESLDSPVADPGHDRGAEIAENVIERTGDSGIEVGGPAVDVRIHHNLIRKSLGSLRFKLPRIGPVFIYRNNIIEGSQYNIWYSMDDSPAEGYVYHNTVVGGRVGLAYNGWRKHHDIGAPRWHYLNNLIVTGKGFFESRDRAIPVNFTPDYNVVAGGGKPYPEDPGKDSHSRYVAEIPMTSTVPPKPLAGGPAIDAGLDLSTYYSGKPLPGCNTKYFRGRAPDAGAEEIR